MKRFVSRAVPALVLVATAALAQQRPAAPAQRPAAPPAPAAAGNVVRVRMQMQGSRYMFEPATFTIHPGDVVEFVNINGFPHNVSFEAAKIPAGAADVLNRAMANRSGNLQGPMMVTANQTYRVSFAGAPVGTYDFFCLPHKAMNMKGTITVAAGASRR